MPIQNNPSYNDGLGELLDSTRYQKYLQAVSYFHHYSYKNNLRVGVFLFRQSLYNVYIEWGDKLDCGKKT